jgi:hypothetical protein
MFRFTIRDLLWLMVVVGMGYGWYLHYQRLTRPPKLYRDEEIWQLTGNRRFIVDDRFDPPFLVVPVGTSMPLSQVFETLGIDPNRLTDFRHTHVHYNSTVRLSWQLSPTYDLDCTTTDEKDSALAFDDPKREIYVVMIQYRENRREPQLLRIR